MIVGAEDTGQRVQLFWAHYDGNAWTSGSLGDGSSLVDARLVPWTNRFVFTWPDPSGARVWRIFESGRWTTPTASAPGRFIAANSSRLLELALAGTGPYTISARFYDGSAWTTPAAVVSGVTNPFPSVAGAGNGFAFLYGVSGTPNGAYVYRFDGTGWVGPTTLVTSTGSVVAFRIVSNGSGYAAAAGSTATVGVFDPATSMWTMTPMGGSVPSVQGLWAAGPGYVVHIGGNAPYARRHDGTTWDATTLALASAVGPQAVAADGTRLLMVAYDYSNYRPVGWVFDGSWGSPFSGTSNAFQDSLSAISAALVGTRGVIPYRANGTARALTYEAGAWADHGPLGAQPLTNGGVIAVRGGATLAAAFGDGKPYVARLWNGSSFGAATVVRTSALDGTAGDARLAFARDGRGLAVWSQYDFGAPAVFGALFDLGWGAPFVIARQARQPRVATNGSGFVISWSAIEQAAQTGQFAARYVPGAGLSTPARLNGALRNYVSTGVELATDGLGYSAAWTRYDSPGVPHDVYVNLSPDGVTWSAPFISHAAATGLSWGGTRVAGNAGGYIVSASDGGSTVVRHYFADAGLASMPIAWAGATACESAAGVTTYGLLCRASPGQVRSTIFTGGAWGSDVMTAADDGGLAIAAIADSYRITAATQTRTWNTSWSAPLTVPNMSVSSMATDGVELVGVGLRPSGGLPSAGLSRTVGGVMQDVGLIESIDSPAQPPFCAWSPDAGFWAAWGQDLPASANAVIYGKGL